jgi:electron transfer flavoprotein alpha subunit
MATLLIAEHNASGLKEGTHRALTAAFSLKSPIHVLVAGYHCTKAADQAARLQGVDRVILVDDEAYANQLVEPISDLIFQLTKGYSYLIAPANCLGKGAMPRVAARLDVMQISEITKVVDHETFERPIYAGNAIQTVRCTDRFLLNQPPLMRLQPLLKSARLYVIRTLNHDLSLMRSLFLGVLNLDPPKRWFQEGGL